MGFAENYGLSIADQPATLGLAMIPPPGGADIPSCSLCAAAATASAATITDAGKGGTGSLLDCRGVQVIGSHPGSFLLGQYPMSSCPPFPS